MGNIKVIKPSSDFEQISGKVIRFFDATTIGIYCKLLCLGASWELNIKGLATILGMSRDRVQKSIGVLEQEGYIVRHPIHKEGKLKGYEYTIYGNCVNEEMRTKAGYAKISQAENQPTQKSAYPEISLPKESAYPENGTGNNDILIDKNIPISKDIPYEKTSLERETEKSQEFIKPSVEEVADYCRSRNNGIDAEEFVAFYESKGWMIGKNKMKKWKSAIITWEIAHKRESVYRPRKESVLEHNLKVYDNMFGTDLHSQAYGKKEVCDEQ